MAQTSSKLETSEQSSKTTSKAKGGSGKVKPSYKHIPHSQKPPHLVAKRNARERRRVQAVNQAFYKLRKCVPIENRNKRVSKVKTLQRAIDYIRKLEQILADDDEASAAAVVSSSSAAESQYGSVWGQVAAVASSNSQQQHPHATQRKTKKSTNCDQVRPANTTATTDLDSNHQQQQIIMKQQRRGRKAAAADQPLATSGIGVTTLPAGNPLPRECQAISTSSYSNNDGAPVHEHQVTSQQPSIEAHKFPEPYYCPQAYQPAPQPQPAEVLRESSAYNNSLNYYNEQQQSQYSSGSYLNGCSTAATDIESGSMGPNLQQYDMYTNNTSNSFYTPTQVGNYAAYASTEAPNASVASLSYLTPATPETLNSWPRLSGGSSHSVPLSASVKSESPSLNDSVGSSSSSTATTMRPAASQLTAGSGGAGPDSSTRAACLALLQSPTSSTSSSPPSASSASSATSSAAVAATANSDNSSPVVARPRTSLGNRQQVNNYLAYASNRMEARAAHLSCFAAANANNNDNNNNNNSHNGYHHRPQQQLNERKGTSNSSTDEVRPPASGHPQARHALNGPASVHLSAAGLSANNLHDHHQQQYHHHPHQHLHQQSSFPNNQHPNPTHLSALHSMAASSPNTNLMHQQQTIQEYTL